MTSVIVFGPTGQGGSAAARTAAEQGAEVWLAMRDTKKSIPGLSTDAEEACRFRRIEADLLNPESVGHAVKASGAKRTFIYLAQTATDHMKGAISAMKTAGVEFVVFLSSFTILTDRSLRDVPSSEIIPYVHAQVEANLDDAFGSDRYVAVRAGAFITNLLEKKKGIAAGKVEMYGGAFEQDNVVPSDIGRVAGNILVSGPRNGQKKVYVYGPEVLSIQDSIARIGKALGKDLTITALEAKDAHDNYMKAGLPKVFADYMVDVLGTKGRDKGHGEVFPNYEEGMSNVKLYTGKPATGLEDWVKESKEVFSK